ncbi:predicted protein [Aspergillus terreus NIH2624]|uniref:Uncharacterized protein n=1 Tax=Aspergillus terreus (strain NIH 2624 / FGSC A1156) TaxID=341663 RepID=Q0CWZ6_ASPTN|nr:uncharacterized protein ATEG_01788 [Aspergillus terreus NIH2624]EAU38545.1 predicted protein [Aspergillus terreus NIH2624]
MCKFKGLLISDLHDRDKGGFDDLVPSKSSPIEHIEMVETSSVTGFMQVIRASKNLKSFRCLGREGYDSLPPGNYMATHFPLNDPSTFVALPDTLPASLERLYVSDFDYPFLAGLRELENLVHAKTDSRIYESLISRAAGKSHPDLERYTRGPIHLGESVRRPVSSSTFVTT